MWKRWILRMAFWYMDRTFNKWLIGMDETRKNAIWDLIVSFQRALREYKTTTGNHIADLLDEWRD